jgi:hypothetical protein
VRDLAERADPFTRKRLLDLADSYDAKGGGLARASRAIEGPQPLPRAVPELRTSLARHEEGRALQGSGATPAAAQVIRQCASPSPAVGSTRRRVRNAAARAA